MKNVLVTLTSVSALVLGPAVAPAAAGVAADAGNAHETAVSASAASAAIDPEI